MTCLLLQGNWQGVETKNNQSTPPNLHQDEHTEAWPGGLEALLH